MSSGNKLGSLILCKLTLTLYKVVIAFMTYQFYYYRLVPLSVQFMADVNIVWVYWYL